MLELATALLPTIETFTVAVIIPSIPLSNSPAFGEGDVLWVKTKTKTRKLKMNE